MALLMKCVKCGEWKDESLFVRRKSGSTRYNITCADCLNHPNINRKSILCIRCKVRGSRSPDGICSECRVTLQKRKVKTGD